jgi:hypothetical protein
MTVTSDQIHIFQCKNTEYKAVVPWNFYWTTEPVQYFHLFIDIYLLNLALQVAIPNGNKKKMQSMLPTKRARITDRLPPTIADMKALLGIVKIMGLHPMSDITDPFLKHGWTKCLSFLMCSQGKSFCSCYGTYILLVLRDKVNWKKEDLIRSVLDVIRSKFIIHYYPSALLL